RCLDPREPPRGLCGSDDNRSDTPTVRLSGTVQAQTMADVRRTGSRPGAEKETAQPSQSVTSYAVSEFGVRVVVAARICASCRCSNAVRPSPRASLRRGYPGAIDVLADQRKGVGIGVIVGLKGG